MKKDLRNKNEKKEIFYIEKILKQNNLNNDSIKSKHNQERKNRIALANTLIANENGILIDSFKVDCGHKNGMEIHNVYSNGIIKIYNVDSRKFITVLIARPNQIMRYYEYCGIVKSLPKETIVYCNAHIHAKLNKVKS